MQLCGTARPQGGQPRPAARGSNINERFTRLIADVRTQKIIVDTSSEQDLELIMDLIDQLDTEVRNLRPSNHIYRVRFLKAADLQQDLQALLDGTSTRGGLTGRNTGRTTGRGTTGRGAAGQPGQQQQLASRVIAHDETNSLIIQAEYEEFLEIKDILEAIDIKRRQVFLEVALVQVNQNSTLNYILEYLAGNLDDQSTRIAALTAFGLSTLDPTQLPALRRRGLRGVGLDLGCPRAASHHADRDSRDENGAPEKLSGHRLFSQDQVRPEHARDRRNRGRQRDVDRPRGLASILFALVVVEEGLLPSGPRLEGIVVLTVLPSTFAQLTAYPLARRYGQYLASARADAAAEHAPASEMPVRVRHSGSTVRG